MCCWSDEVLCNLNDDLYHNLCLVFVHSIRFKSIRIISWNWKQWDKVTHPKVNLALKITDQDTSNTIMPKNVNFIDQHYNSDHSSGTTALINLESCFETFVWHDKSWLPQRWMESGWDPLKEETIKCDNEGDESFSTDCSVGPYTVKVKNYFICSQADLKLKCRLQSGVYSLVSLGSLPARG